MKSHYIDSNDLKIHVVCDPPNPEKETVLFIHGFPDNNQTWHSQFAAFKGKFRLAAFDLRGITNPLQETPPESYKMPDLLSDLTSVIDYLVGKNGRVHLVGHDWGAVISWVYVADPALSKRIISFSAISCPHPKLFFNNTFERLQTTDLTEISKSLEQISKSWYILFFQLPFLPEIFWQFFGEWAWKELLNQCNVPYDDPGYNISKEEILSGVIGNINLYREILQGDIPELPIHRVETPVLVIIPEHDLAINPMVYEGTKDYFPNAELTYMNANHWVHREKSFQVNLLLERFWAGLKSSKFVSTK